MLIKDSAAVRNQWCMPVNLLGGAILFDPWFTQYKFKVIKYEYVKTSNKIIEIVTRKSDKNQLEPGKGVGLSPQIYQLDIRFIFWFYMKIISFAYS